MNINKKEKNKNKHEPIRMCVSCKNRQFKKDLSRFQCANTNSESQHYLISYKNNENIINGRSFYICQDCLDSYSNNKIKFQKQFVNSIMRTCNKNKQNKIHKNRLDELILHFKEIIFNVANDRDSQQQTYNNSETCERLQCKI
jgi:predicted RNA-binding protein YlxR (DUF448 family)